MNNMPNVTDWLMVGITVVYVIATICIWVANNRTARASREQLEESKRQFNENRRLDVMPYLQFEPEYDLMKDYSLELVLFGKGEGSFCNLKTRVKNIGKGTAKDIKMRWIGFDNQSDQQFPVYAMQSGERFTMHIGFSYDLKQFDPQSAYFDMSFKDLLENEYMQRVELAFKWNGKGEHAFISNMNTFPPILVRQDK